MRTHMLGMDTNRAELLAHTLNRWPHAADRVTELVVAATTLSDVDPGVDAALDRIATDGLAMGRAIETARDELLAHQLAVGQRLDDVGIGQGTFEQSIAALVGLQPDLESDGRSEQADLRAQELIDRIRAAEAAGKRPDAGDLDRLHRIFENASGEDATAVAAIGLALGGLPAHDALHFESLAEIDAEFDRVLVAMQAGQAPIFSGVHTSLFPPGYRRWHELTMQIEHLETTPILVPPSDVDRVHRHRYIAIADLVEQLREVELRLGLGRVGAMSADGAVDRFDATTSIGAHLGAVADRWAGTRLAPGVLLLDGDRLQHVGELLPGRHEFASAFFTRLGAREAARIPATLASWDVFDPAIDDYAAGLGLASHDPYLGFTGADLVAHDLVDINPLAVMNPGAHVEQLLGSPAIDPGFATEGIVASLRLRWPERHQWPKGLYGAVGDAAVDPRQAALGAAVSAGVVPRVIAALDGTDALELLFDRRIERASPLTTRSAPDTAARVPRDGRRRHDLGAHTCRVSVAAWSRQPLRAADDQRRVGHAR